MAAVMLASWSADRPGLPRNIMCSPACAVPARVEDVAPDPRKDSLGRLEVEAPLEEVRRPAMLCRELREPPGVAAGPIQSLILEGERLVDLPLRLPASDGHEAIRIGLR